MVYVGVSLFAETRLPGDGSVTLNQDVTWGISLAADLLHHFPLSDPNVSGQPLPYHYFVSAHMAAASQVTGLDLPLIYLRLQALPLIACAVVGFAAAGQRLFGSATTGTLAGGLTMLVGELQLDPRLIGVGQVVFLGTLFTLILASPSFVLGIVILIPLLVLLAERLASERGTLAEWALLALLVVGASGAKITILPLLALALVFYAGWLLLRTRRIARPVIVSAAIVIGVMGAFYLNQYRGHSSGVELDLTAGYDFIQSMPGITTLKDGAESFLPDFPGRGGLLDVVAVPVGLLGLFAAQLCGVWLYLRRRTEPVPVAGVWLLCVLAAGALGMAVLIDRSAYSQLYYVFYATMAGGLLAAAGFVDSWTAAEPRDRRSVLGLTGGFLAVLALAIAVILAVADLDAGLPTTGAFWALYAAFVVLLVATWAVARRRLSSRALAPLVVCIGIVAVGLIDAPVDHVIPALKDRPAATDARANLTPELNDAFVWVRDNTDEEAIVATSFPGPLNFDPAAFSERRVFLGGWAYSDESRGAGYGLVVTGEANPFADRLALNTAAFTGDAEALEALRGDGVDYLIVDRVNGPQPPEGALEGAGPVVFENADATVIEL